MYLYHESFTIYVIYVRPLFICTLREYIYFCIFVVYFFQLTKSNKKLCVYFFFLLLQVRDIIILQTTEWNNKKTKRAIVYKLLGLQHANFNRVEKALFLWQNVEKYIRNLIELFPSVLLNHINILPAKGNFFGGN